MVYEDIMCMDSTRNVEKVIKIVLEKLAGIECERLPKATFSICMLIEAHGRAQLQIASKLANCEDDDLVLQSDGTSKKGHSYTTFDATNNEEQFFVLGMQEVGAGDTQTQLDLLKEIMGDISSFNKEDISDKFLHPSKTSCQTVGIRKRSLINSSLNTEVKLYPKWSDSETLSSNEQKETCEVINLPLYPFLGNWLNILFLNGAGGFYLFSYLE